MKVKQKVGSSKLGSTVKKLEEKTVYCIERWKSFLEKVIWDGLEKQTEF